MAGQDQQVLRVAPHPGGEVIHLEQAGQPLRILLALLQVVDQADLALDERLAAAGQVDEHRVHVAAQRRLVGRQPDRLAVNLVERPRDLADLVEGVDVDRLDVGHDVRALGLAHAADRLGQAHARRRRSGRTIDRPTITVRISAITRISSTAAPTTSAALIASARSTLARPMICDASRCSTDAIWMSIGFDMCPYQSAGLVESPASEPCCFCASEIAWSSSELAR